MHLAALSRGTAVDADTEIRTKALSILPCRTAYGDQILLALAVLIGFALLHLLEPLGVRIPIDIKLGLSLAFGSGSNQTSTILKRMGINLSKRVASNPFPRSLTRISGGPSWCLGMCTLWERAYGGRGAKPPLRTNFLSKSDIFSIGL